MAKPMLIILLLFCSTLCHAQNGFIVLKKGHRTIRTFWKDSQITFQLKDGQWLSGIINKIAPDSFYFTQEIIRLTANGADTLKISGAAFALADIKSMPTKNELINYENDRVKIILGNEKFAWVRNGFIFRVAGAGYAGLNITNSLISHSPPFARSNLLGLGISAAVFLFGEILHLKFDPYIHIGKKFRLECLFTFTAPPIIH